MTSPTSKTPPDAPAEEETSMSGLEKARATLLNAGLAFPKIPEALANNLQEKDKWVFSSRDVTMWPYDLHLYVNESYKAPQPYVLLANAGYGINSYVLAYYLIFGPLRLFLHLGWGGIYMDKERDAKQIRECFSLADEILPTAMISGKLAPDEQLLIVCSDSYDSYWGLSEPTRIRQSHPTSLSPTEFLTKLLEWLKDPKPRRPWTSTKSAL